MSALGMAAALLGEAPAAGQMMEPDDSAPAVQSPAAQKFKELTETEGAEKKQAKDKVRPPFEFFRTRVAPFDILPFIKAGHWSTVTLELRANLFDYDGQLQTAPVPLLGMPQQVVFRRDVHLGKAQPEQPAMQVMLPEARNKDGTLKREISLDLVRPDSIRPDDGTQAPLRWLEAHQMLIPILARDPNAYANWARFLAMRPASGNQDVQVMEQRRYYRVSIPQEPEKPLVSAHSLTWTTTSHVIWDDFDPNALGPGQQRAMLDWLHWGGQLIVVGGASRTLALLADRESFLGPYLPAEPSGENASLTEADLRSLARAYRPSEGPSEFDDIVTLPGGASFPYVSHRRYRPPRRSARRPIGRSSWPGCARGTGRRSPTAPGRRQRPAPGGRGDASAAAAS
jgi:hypothetical protein